MNDADAIQAGLTICTPEGGYVPRRMIDGRKSRAIKGRVIDFRASEVFFSVIVEIGKDIFVRKLPASEVARKHQISRRTVQRYKKRLMRGQK